MDVLDALHPLLRLGQQVWQQQEGRQDEGAAVCFVSIAPFLLAAAAIGLRSVRQSLRARGTSLGR